MGVDSWIWKRLSYFKKNGTFFPFPRYLYEYENYLYEYEKYTTDNHFSYTFTVVWSRLYVPAFNHARLEDAAGYCLVF